MSSSEAEQLNELDRLIKNTEFEASQQAKGIAEERQKIQSLQIQQDEYRDRAKEVKIAALRSEDAIKKQNRRLIQLKEHYKSLKKTSAVLDDHCEALQRKFQLTSQSSTDQRKVQLDSINKYMGIWKSYERKYLSSTKAQKFLALKKELDMMLELKESLVTKIKLLEARVSSNNRKESHCLVSSIVKISAMKVQTLDNSQCLSELVTRCKTRTQYVIEKRREIESLKLMIEKQKKERLHKKALAVQLQSKVSCIPKLDNQNKPTSTVQKFSLKLELPSALKDDKTRTMTNIDSPTLRRAVTVNMPTPVQSDIALEQHLTESSNGISIPEPVPMETVDTTQGNAAEELTKQVQDMCVDQNVTRVDQGITRVDQDVTRVDQDVTRVDQGITCVDQGVNRSYKDTCSLSVQKLTAVDQNIKPPLYADVAPKLNVTPQVGGVESIHGASLFSSDVPSNSQVPLDQMENYPVGDLFAQNIGDSTWLGQTESSNFDSMFSAFTGAPPNEPLIMGDLFSGISNISNSSSSEGALSLFGSTKTTPTPHSEAEGFQMNFGETVTSADSSAFSLFQ